MQHQLDNILQTAKSLISSAKNAADIQALRIKYLGKKSDLTELMKQLGQLSAEERPKAGQLINDVKSAIQVLLNEQENQFKTAELNKKLSFEKIDVTLPGRGQQSLGSLHPVTKVRERVVELFSQMGFSVEEGPEIEDDYHNFSALNFVDHHPAKESQDTFYFSDGKLLRTHTSPVQIRYMETHKPPFAIVVPGKTFRNEATDATHEMQFHQVEGLMIGENITMANMKAVLLAFYKKMLGPAAEVRFIPSFFPFTEPSVEFYVKFGDKWLEMGGGGMVHPEVLKNCGIDSTKYQGFAFGPGLERPMMVRHSIPDVRLPYQGDLRFNQF